jgi:SAM-dependent methyltransferase
MNGCADCAGGWTCAACGSVNLESVVCLGDRPLANGLLSGPTQDPARYPLHVLICTACLAVQLTRQVPPAVMFGAYPYFSSQSATMVASAEQLARRIIAAYRLGPADVVVEVGSNDGYLLRWYAGVGIRTIGIDPAVDCAAAAERFGIETIVDYFGSDLADAHAGTAAVVHANNVLAHVPDPATILEGIHRMLRPRGVAIIETPWLVPMVDQAQFDVIYHEHRWYWSLLAFERLLTRAGLHIVDVEHLPLHGGSLRIFATAEAAGTTPAAKTGVMAAERAAGLDSAGGLADFAERVAVRIGQLHRWRDRLPGRVAGYGAAAKGTMMLAQIGPVDWVVDSTPAKIGRWLPVAGGIPIRHTDTLFADMPPDCVVLAWNFADEIAHKASGYTRRGGRLWTTTPHPTLIEAQDALSA